jgi:N utilization substance protein B
MSLNSRRVARELALLTMAQLTNRNEKAPTSLHEMLARAADMLAGEARERLQEAGADLVSSEAKIHEAYIEVSGGDKLAKADLEAVLAAIDKAQEAVELLGSAIELPAQVALADADDVKAFVKDQVERYTAHKLEIDRKLEEAAQNWSVERMASLDRDVLRIAVGELLWAPEVPVEVAINEAVELAKKYGTPDSGRFVNGVLSRFAEEGARIRGGKPNVV